MGKYSEVSRKRSVSSDGKKMKPLIISKTLFPLTIAELYRITSFHRWCPHDPPVFAFNPERTDFYNITDDVFKIFPFYFQAKLTENAVLYRKLKHKNREVRKVIPFDNEDVLAISKAIEFANLKLGEGEYNERLLGVSNKMLSVFNDIDQAIETEAPVLILGETGTGKELVARAIWSKSCDLGNTNKPFIAFNCAALPSELIEAELFGYEKGAFSGANIKGKKGIFEQAKEGIVFIDEIGEAPPPVQVKLLRVLNERTFRKVGGEHEIKLKARIIAATNQPLDKPEARCNPPKNVPIFREDLYHRLVSHRIHVPSLRERLVDIPILLYYFQQGLSKKKFNLSPGGLSPVTLTEILFYDWHGNVRELRNAVFEIYHRENEYLSYQRLNEFKLLLKDFDVHSNERILSWIKNHITSPGKIDSNVPRKRLKELEKLFGHKYEVINDDFEKLICSELQNIQRVDANQIYHGLINHWIRMRKRLSNLGYGDKFRIYYRRPMLLSKQDAERVEKYFKFEGTEKQAEWLEYCEPWLKEEVSIHPYFNFNIFRLCNLLKELSGNDPWSEIATKIRGNWDDESKEQNSTENETQKKPILVKYVEAQNEFETEYWTRIFDKHHDTTIAELRRLTGVTEKTIRKKKKQIKGNDSLK
jgi:DNA-binding NtrC family response regulator